ncbi:hypothetical protein [Anaerostipes hadrus]|uniref:hypothetical protein n=1 Tax=Anaerostipes hadrus TaxID=649756 RepID=UPI000678CF21|nr:hypothetical protein [Anaerostipes hadrus]
MSVKTVQATINGQTYTLTLNSSTGKYEATVTAPSKSSYNQSGHYYGVTVKATDEAGKTTTITRTVTLDTTAPVIKSVTLTPNPVDAGKTFIISVEVTD